MIFRMKENWYGCEVCGVGASVRHAGYFTLKKFVKVIKNGEAHGNNDIVT
jgi:hypothetical protein